MSSINTLRSKEIFIIIYSISIALTNTILIFLGEIRLDVYISLYILEYYIYRALITPLPKRVNRYLRLMDIGLFIIFSIIVAYRVIQIIAPELLGRWLL